MKEALEKIIWKFIYSVINDDTISRKKQVKKIYRKLVVYNYGFLDNRNYRYISKDFCNSMVFNIITRKELPEYYETVIGDIADKIIEKKAKELF